MSFFHSRPERRISAVKPSLPILQKLIASDAIIGIHVNMESDSTIFPECASRANFNVRVCLFTSHMADSATPLVPCSPSGLSRKTRSTNEAANKVADLRATTDGPPSLCSIDNEVDATPSMTWHTRSLLSLADTWQHRSQLSHLWQPR